MADGVRTVWFHRDYQRLTGGHLKHAHYFGHVQHTAGFAPKLTLRGNKLSTQLEREREDLWPVPRAELADEWLPRERDVFFLAGADWRYLEDAGLDQLPNPRINLIQGMRHADARSELYRYLNQRAIRICVSPEVADSIVATGRANGPVLTIPNGIDAPYAPIPKPKPRPSTTLIVGYKRPLLADALSKRLHETSIAHRVLNDFQPRPAFLDSLARSDVVVCLPYPEEGFYLPALEAMAAGCITVTLDCVGNRGFSHHGRNCIVAAATIDALFKATKAALDMTVPEQESLLNGAHKTAAAYSLVRERERFQIILHSIDRLWQ